MMNRVSIVFCMASLALTAAVLVAGFHIAAVPRQSIATAKTPVPPESLPDINMPDFGKVSVVDMMNYYIENPPAVTTADGGATSSAKRFGGC